MRSSAGRHPCDALPRPRAEICHDGAGMGRLRCGMIRAPIANALIFSVLTTVIAAGAMLLVIVGWR
jgi:hypothetical protein